MSFNWADKRVFVTGACGTIGKELVGQLTDLGAEKIVCFDNNESELFFLGQKYRKFPKLTVIFGDLRDPISLTEAMKGCDTVIHAAAMKHVRLCEAVPRDVVLTNVIGGQNVIESARANGVEKCLLTSSDKAVSPTNVMGATKLLAERLMTAADNGSDRKRTAFFSTRFGNVLGSRGSVVPLFMKQIKLGGPVTLTDPQMTRFIMTLEHAVHLVLRSCEMAKGGEVFVMKMPVVCIKDLAEVMIEEFAPKAGYQPEDIKIEVIGITPGEKKYEELLSEEEIRRTLITDDFLLVTPPFQEQKTPPSYDSESLVQTEKATKPYNSSLETPISKLEIKKFLNSDNSLKSIV